MRQTLDSYAKIGQFALDTQGSKEAAIAFLEKDIERWANQRKEREVKARATRDTYKGTQETNAIADLSSAINWVKGQQ